MLTSLEGVVMQTARGDLDELKSGNHPEYN